MQLEHQESPSKMEQSVQTTGAALRETLRDTWIHRIFNKLRNAKRDLMRQSEGEAFLLERYRRLHGKSLDVKNPQTFTEKLNCRMVFWNRGHDPIFTQLTDKYAARAYVASRVGERHLIKLLWHGEDARAIPFHTLPEEYVIKTNHACRQVMIVKGPAERDAIISKVSGWLSKNYYWGAREYQYYHIKPKVLIEECLRNEDGSMTLDYKFWCFRGTPEVIQLNNHSRGMNPFYDTAWNLLDLHYREDAARPVVAKPANLEQMMSIASRLSADFDFVRVDLYSVNERIYFGELTFTPTAGTMKLRPERWDLELGKKWEMSLNN